MASGTRKLRRSARAGKVAASVRSLDQLVADGKASSYRDADGSMVLFGKRVSVVTLNPGEPARIIWEDGTSLDFPDWETLQGVLLKFGWEFEGFKVGDNA